LEILGIIAGLIILYVLFKVLFVAGQIGCGCLMVLLFVLFVVAMATNTIGIEF
jgi:hypothetical protein